MVAVNVRFSLFDYDVNLQSLQAITSRGPLRKCRLWQSPSLCCHRFNNSRCEHDTRRRRELIERNLNSILTRYNLSRNWSGNVPKKVLYILYWYQLSYKYLNWTNLTLVLFTLIPTKSIRTNLGQKLFIWTPSMLRGTTNNDVNNFLINLWIFLLIFKNISFPFFCPFLPLACGRWGLDPR